MTEVAADADAAHRARVQQAALPRHHTVIAGENVPGQGAGFDSVDPATGVVFNRGRTVLVCADAQLRPTELPAATRAALERHLVA